MSETAAIKHDIRTIAEKKRIVTNIARLLETNDSFLVIGHENPDEDCIASMVSIGLLLSMMNKRVQIDLSTSFQEQFRYLLNICRYNAIKVHEGQDMPDLGVHVIFILDTPKPEMIGTRAFYKKIFTNPKVSKIEIDHHLGGDSTYIGDEGLQLVASASSTCELIGYMLYKLSADSGFMKRNNLQDLFQRNMILSILTGMIADSHMGQYLKSRKERFFYDHFCLMFERMLVRKTREGSGNFSSKEELFKALASLSGLEEACFDFLSRSIQSLDKIKHALLDDSQSAKVFENFGADTLVSVSKALTDQLAEESGYLGLVAYRDDPALSPFVQFRLRRSKAFTGLDLRDVLKTLSIENGGGHPGAVGFRIERDKIADLGAYYQEILRNLEKMIGDCEG